VVFFREKKMMGAMISYKVRENGVESVQTQQRHVLHGAGARRQARIRDGFRGQECAEPGSGVGRDLLPAGQYLDGNDAGHANLAPSKRKTSKA
jgi:hypothetical protein